MQLNDLLINNVKKANLMNNNIELNQRYKVDLNKFEGDILLYKDFTSTRPQKKLREEKLGYKNTMCDLCSSICHINCNLGETNGQRGHPLLSSCFCISDDVCKVCNHSRMAHFNNDKREVEYTDYVTDTDYQKKQNYTNSLDAKTIKERDIQRIEAEIDQMKASLQSIYETLAKTSKKIKQISLLPYNDAYVDYLEQELNITKHSNIDPNEKAKKKYYLEEQKKDYLCKKKLIEEAENKYK